VLQTLKVEMVDSGVEEPPFVSRLRSMRPASSNIIPILLSYVVSDVLCPKRMLSSTMAPTSLAGYVVVPKYPFKGCTKQLGTELRLGGYSKAAPNNLECTMWRCGRINDNTNI
jgi:hypothetical protein